MLKREDGWVLVTAVMLMSVMMAVGLASISLVDTQQKRTREQRAFESGLNLGEAVLYAQGFKLTRSWPSAGEARGGLLVSACGDDALPDRDILARPLKNVTTNVDTRTPRRGPRWFATTAATCHRLRPGFADAAQTG